MRQLRDDTEKKAMAIQVASQRKPPPKEACGLFNAFSAAELKMLKYATDNAASCRIPPQIIAIIKRRTSRPTEMRTKVCPRRRAAAAGRADA